MAIVGAAGRAASRKRRSKASANRILAHERFERERAKTSVWLVKFDANDSGALDRKELQTMMKFINEDDSVRYDGVAWGWQELPLVSELISRRGVWRGSHLLPSACFFRVAKREPKHLITSCHCDSAG